jgi:hypothetical protein
MKRVIALALTFTATLLGGCAHHYNLHSIQRAEPLDRKASALVTLPEDGSFEKITYPGSGRQTARAVAAAFAKHLARVDIMPAPATSAEQLAAARSGGFDYLVTPSIAHWEDRATEWSGRPDRIEIELRTLRTTNGATLNLGSIEGRSRWGTLGGDSPEDMLPKPIGLYVDWLFAAPGAPMPSLSEPRPPTAQSPRHTP